MNPVGNNDTSLLTRHEGNYASVVVDNFDSIYSVYSDVNLANKLTVKKYGNGVWKTLGVEGFTAGGTSFNSMEVSESGVPYVAFVDNANGNKATVMKFNGSSWVTVGSAGFSVSAVSNTTLALDSTGTPYIAYKDAAYGDKASVKFFNGNSWISLGPAGFTPDTALTPFLKINKSGIPHVVFQDLSNSDKASLMYYNGSAWTSLGTAGFTTGAASQTSFAFDSSGTPYVAFKDLSTNKASVMKYYGNSWTMLNDSGIPAIQPDYLTIAVSKAGVPYLAYGSFYYMIALKYNGSTWDYAYITYTNGLNKFTSIAVSPIGTAILGYLDWRNDNSPTVLRWIQDDWENLSHPGIVPTAGGVQLFYGSDENLLSMDNSGNLYFVNAGSNSLLKEVGGNWEYVGNKGDVGAKAVSLCFDQQQNPCIAYGNSISFVKRFDGISWNNVGSLTSLSFAIPETSLTSDSAGNLYVISYDFPGSRIFKFNGTSWDSLGQLITGDVLKLGFNNSGELLMVKTIRTDSTRLFLSKFNGVSWTTIGLPGTIPLVGGTSGVAEIKATITKSGLAYAVYHLHSSECKVMKFNGATWSGIGGSSLNLGAFGAVLPSIATDTAGVPYVSARRYGGNGPDPVMVFRYNGTNWISTGNIISDLGSPSQGTSLAIDPVSNIPYVSFGGFCPYVKKLVCANTTAIESNTPVNEILLYPNPGSSRFTLSSKKTKINSIQVFNLLGEELKNQDVGENEVTLNLVNLPPGIFLVEITTDKARITKNW